MENKQIWIECDPVSSFKLKNFAEKWGFTTEKKIDCIGIVIPEKKKEIFLSMLVLMGITKQKRNKKLIILDEKKFKNVCKEFKL